MNAILSAYCACAVCCGDWSTERGGPGLTAFGTLPREGRTIAGPRSIPLGTWVTVRFPGGRQRLYRVEDRTARAFDGRWDVFMAEHSRARKHGVRPATVLPAPGGRGK